jgi:hypothetical protein
MSFLRVRELTSSYIVHACLYQYCTYRPVEYAYCKCNMCTFIEHIYIYMCVCVCLYIVIKNVRDSQPYFLVQFIPIGLWQSCYTVRSRSDTFYVKSKNSTICGRLSSFFLSVKQNSTSVMLKHLFSHLKIHDSSLIPIIVHQFFTGIALGDVDLYFSFTMVRRANITEAN